MITRREFLGASGAMVSTSILGGSAIARSREPLDMLFLGGTGFIGPHQINHALARGHRVAMFNRGRNAGLYGDAVEELVGNRDANVDDGLRALASNRRWDVVVDNSGYVPRHVRDSVELLKDRCSRYIYVSTRGVYDFSKGARVDESGPLLPAPEPYTEDTSGDYYGPQKAECDRIVQRELGGKATILRPPYIVGPGDTTDRFTYWVERFHRGGDIVCPAGPDMEAQWIDARDFCEFVIHLAENDTAGIFNVAGPASPMTNEELMLGLRAFASAPTRLHWPTQDQLDAAGFDTLMFGSRPVSVHIEPARAVAAGLAYRSLATTVRDTHDWWQSQPAERRANPRRWPTAEQEQAVVAMLRR